MNMKQFKLHPTIQAYDTFAEFATVLNLGPDDLVFTVRFLAEKWIKPLGVSSTVLCFEDYGSGEPTDELMDRILVDSRKGSFKRIVAIGGGSVIDIAKLMVLRATGSARQFFERTAPLVKEKALVIVPTTCGTGSEVTAISIGHIVARNTKLGLTADELFADKAVLIPELIYGLPEFVLVTSSLDALIHALESYVSPKSNVFTEAFSVPAMRMILGAYKTFLKSGRSKATIPTIANDLLVGATYGGIAFSNAGVGAVHALSYPLGGVHHVPHGEANARILNAVFDVYAARNATGKIAELTALLGDVLEVPKGSDPLAALQTMVDALLPKKALREYGMTEAEIDGFTDSVLEFQTRLLANNYVPLSRDEIRGIYARLW